MEIELHQFSRKKFPPVGTCIYCGAPGTREEHVIPYALGGNVVLPNASCPACEAITSYVDGVLGRGIFGAMKSSLKIQKRKRKSEQVVSIVFETESGQETRTIPISDAPPFLLLQCFDGPGALEGRPPSPAVCKDNWVWVSDKFRQYSDNLRKPGDKKWTLAFQFNTDVFIRGLAKIAHGFATAHFGFGTFKPFLPNLILGKDKNSGFLVGGWAPATEPAQLPQGRIEAVGHELSFMQFGDDVTGHRLLVASVRLFPFTGAPTYCAVLGEPGPQIIEQLS